MNRQEQDILNILAGGTFSGQRELAEESGYSLGVVNRCLRSLTETGYVRADGTLTQNGQALLAENRPRRAVILAAAVFVCMKWTPLKKLHPILFIAAAAVVGIIFQF